MAAEAKDRGARLALEGRVLGGMLRFNASIPDVVQSVTKDDFTSLAGQYVFAGIVDLWERGKPADPATVFEWLAHNGKADDAPPSWLAELWDGEPTGANTAYYAGLLRERSVESRLQCAGQAIMERAARHSGSAQEQLEEAEREIFAIAEVGFSGSTVDLQAAVDEAYDAIDARTLGKCSSGVATGFADLDELTGGFRNSELVILAARPSHGKTSLATNIALNVALAGTPVFFVSLEQSLTELGERVLVMNSGVPSGKVRKGMLSADDVDRLSRARGAVAGAPLRFSREPGQTVLRIAANARRLRMREKIGLVVVDYVQLIEPDNRRLQRHEQVSSAARRLKILAKELNVPVVALAQLRRDADERRPRLSDLKESGGLEEHADTVILLSKDEQYSEVVRAEVAKQRNGPTGEVGLYFRKEFMRFENLSYENQRAS